MMKVLLQQFLGLNHSWSVTGQNIARALIKKGHDVHLFSTNGTQYFPEDLKSNLIGYINEETRQVFGKAPDGNYDCQISYTAMRNFPQYLSHGNKNRFGIWCYEWKGKNVLPLGFAKNYKFCDKILAPSIFAKQGFVDSGVPESTVEVISHGIDVEQYNQSSKILLPTTKTFKMLANIAQNHKRKNLVGLLNAYGKAFSRQDDVCLILKAKHKKPTQNFEISLQDCLDNFNRAYPNHAEIKLFTEFVDDIAPLYRSVDAVVSLTHGEGFYYPGLEAIASGKLVIAPNWGGQLDFLDQSNSLLINGREVRADPTSMYWSSRQDAIWFMPNIDDAVDKLKYAFNNFGKLNSEIEQNRPKVYEKYSWNNIVDQILELTKE